MKRTLLLFPALFALPCAGRADDWPQWMGAKRDAIWTETGIVDKFPEGGPKKLWSMPLGGGYSGPAVAGGKVYVTDFRTGGKIDNNPQARPNLDGTERVLCFDAKTGKELWKHEYPCKYSVSYPAGPRCTPTVTDGKVYTVGSMGDLYCLDAGTGKPIWSKNYVKDYGAKVPIWGFAGHPLVDGDKVVCIVGGENSVAVAFDKDTGKELWHNLSASEPGYSSPAIIEAGGKRQLLIWHAQELCSLDLTTGAKYWSVELNPNFGMAIMAPQKSGDYLYAGGIGNKSIVLKLAKDKPAVEEVYRGRKDSSIYPVNMTPLLEGDIIYGVDQPGKLMAVELLTGKRLWETTVPVAGVEVNRAIGSGTAFLVKNGDRHFLFGETGHLIIAKLSPKGYEEISRAKVIEPTNTAFGRDVAWHLPAFADKCVFVRNDKEIICYSLAK